MEENFNPETSQGAIEEPGTSGETNHLGQATERALKDTEEPGTSQETTQAIRPKTAPTLTDLDKLEKFVWQGKVVTAKELRDGWLRQQDYTKKTREIAESTKGEQKYWDNLKSDLANVRNNPALALKFKEIYPAKFHALVDEYFEQRGDQNQNQNQGSLDPRVLAQLNGPLSEMKAMMDGYKARETAAINAQLDGFAAKYQAKFALAQENEVLSKVEYLIEQALERGEKNPEIDEAMWEKLWKSSHDYHAKRYQDFYQKQVTDQAQANKRASDVPRGGSAASRPQKEGGLRSGRDAMEAEIARMKAGG